MSAHCRIKRGGDAYFLTNFEFANTICLVLRASMVKSIAIYPRSGASRLGLVRLA